MNSHKTILITTAIYVLIFVITIVGYSQKDYTGSDPAGNAMSAGITTMLIFGILFLLAVIITIFNAFSFKSITSNWVKLAFFTPIALPFLTVFFLALLDGNRDTSVKKQAHRLTLEIRSNQLLPEPYISFRTSNGSSGGSLKLDRDNAPWFIYKSTHSILYQTERKFQISYDTISTQIFYTKIAYKPTPAPFTNWENLPLDTATDNDSLIMQVRYKVEK